MGRGEGKVKGKSEPHFSGGKHIARMEYGGAPRKSGGSKMMEHGTCNNPQG